MRPLARPVAAFAAVGAGLIHLALVLGAPPVAAAPLVIIGIVEFGWGVFTTANSRVAAPRAVVVAALAPVLGIAPLAIAAHVRIVPLLLAGVLELLVAAVVARELRRADAAASVTPTGRYILGLIVAAVVVAAVTVPALASTQAAEFVAPAGTFDDEHDGH